MKESELEDRIMADPSRLLGPLLAKEDAELLAIWRQISVPTGRLDILALCDLPESGPICYIIELKASMITHSAIVQVLRYIYDINMIAQDAGDWSGRYEGISDQSIARAWGTFYGNTEQGLDGRFRPVLIGPSIAYHELAACEAAGITVLTYREAEGDIYIKPAYLTYPIEASHRGSEQIMRLAKTSWAKTIGLMFGCAIRGIALTEYREVNDGSKG